MSKIIAWAIMLSMMAGLAGCAAGGAYTNAPDWRNAPNRQAG